MTGKFFSGSAVRKCSSIECAPASNCRKPSIPNASAMGKPIADHKEKRPPTQSQSGNTFCSSIPNCAAALRLVVMATKCLSVAVTSVCCCSQSRAASAFFSVSSVEKDLEAMMKRVVSAWRPLRVSWRCEGSTFDTKCTLSFLVAKALSASQTMAGPRSEPPIPRLTTSVIILPL